MDIPTEQKCDSMRYPDLHVRNEGSIFLVDICTDTGARWIGENTDTENRMFFGSALVVEHRYIRDLVEGAIESGLRVV